MSHPPVLTPERIDAMISGVAEICFAAAQKAGDRLQAAEDMADFERGGRTLNTACRNLRQTIAMKQRFDREQAAFAADQRREAEGERKDAERAHRDALGRHRLHVRRHFERVLWNEYEDDDAQERFEDIDERLGDLSEDAAFLETPVETLIARLAEEVGLGAEGEAGEGPGEPEAPESSAEDAEDLSPASANPRRPLRALRALRSDCPPPVAEAAPEAAPPPEPDPPPRPPDPPPPEPPYIPPWDRVPKGRPPPTSWMG